MHTVLIVDDSEMLLNYLGDSFKKHKDKFRTEFALKAWMPWDIQKKGYLSLSH